MKKAYKLTALALSALSLATVGLTACDGSAGGVKEPKVNSDFIYNGTHIYKTTATNDYLVKGAETNYKLVVPAEMTATEEIAKKEFVHLFKKATKIELEVVADSNVTDASNGKYISLGRTTLLEDSGISMEYSYLTQDGHKVVTQGDDIYLCGGGDTGTVFSVYTFMNLTFNYETYTYNYMEIEETSEKKLLKYDVTDIPDFKTRAHSSDVTMYSNPDYDINMYAWRMNYRGREATRGMYYMRVHEVLGDFTSKSGASTNANRWFPEKIYNDKENRPDDYHPYWFSTNGGEQLCFSARGDAAEYEAMVDLAFQKVKTHLQYYTPEVAPNARIMTLTHMDNQQYCTCPKCFEISSYYGGSQAAVQILFMNDLAERVDRLLEDNKDQPWYREDFKLLFFAYNHNYEPPAYYDALKKEYVPYDDDVILHHRVIAWFCRNSNGQGVFDEDLNSEAIGTLKGWGAVAKNIQYWNYGANFRNYLISLDTYQYTTSEMFGFFCNQSDTSWFTQYQDHNDCPNTAWASLKIYMDSHMAWNTSLQQQDLINKFMKAVYKEAAQTMLTLFHSYRAYQRHVLIDQKSLVSQGDGGADMVLVEYWPIGIVEGFVKLIDKALSEVEFYKDIDPELHDTICRNIEMEAISYIYLLLELHGRTLAKEERALYIERIKHDIDWLDIPELWMRSNETNLSQWISNLK